MVGQAVILRLASQYTPAVVTAYHGSGVVDLRALALRADGQVVPVDIPMVARGPSTDQWQELPWPVQPLAALTPELMPASSMSLPAMPTMVIIRY